MRHPHDVSDVHIGSVTLGNLPQEFAPQSDVCVHLNGFARGLTADKLDAELKLTTTSYLSETVADPLGHICFGATLELPAQSSSSSIQCMTSIYSESFPVTLYELYSGEPIGAGYRGMLEVAKQGEVWRVDHLPRGPDTR